MGKKIFETLARYNQIANGKMDEIIKTLSDDEWNREFNGFFKSIRALCSHVYIADITWLKRFGGIKEFKTLKDGLFQSELSFKDLLFPHKDEYLAKRPELDKLIINLIAELDEDDLGKNLKYVDSHGTPHEHPFYGTLLQVLNHETHHRGMVSLYLELLGKDNDFSGVLAAF
ncbi:diguanylate cyclase [Spirochaetia bacterium]|nr:diguanylate cyclase [Spirochaetia bacterium]